MRDMISNSFPPSLNTLTEVFKVDLPVVWMARTTDVPSPSRKLGMNDIRILMPVVNTYPHLPKGLLTLLLFFVTSTSGD